MDFLTQARFFESIWFSASYDRFIGMSKYLKKNKLKNASDFYCLMMTVNLLSIKNTEFYTVIGQIDQKFSKKNKINQWDFGIWIFGKIYQSRVRSSGGISTIFFELPKFGFGIIRASQSILDSFWIEKDHKKL